ncbi:MAG: hypothetical protein FD147_327 [Chloroflexi bacterium]|nr:MAG: hypothetical protein FD147_327 [Chloroflexota bacterium]
MSVPSPQGYAIELYFDPQMEERVLAFRESIYKLGIDPVLGKMGDKPHVSLAVFSKAEPENLKQVAFAFSQRLKRFPVQLDAIGTFPTIDNVLFLTPIPTVQLLKTHEDFHRMLKKVNLNPSPYYLPNRWVPHCTLEFNLPDEQLNLAVHLCKQHFTPIRGWFAELGVIAFRPIEYLVEYPLQIQE